LSDVYEDDANDLVLNEINNTPGYDFEFRWTGVPDVVLQLTMLGYYNGNAAHNVKLYQWDYTDEEWDAVTAEAQDIPEDSSEQAYQWTLLTPNSRYISGGELRIQIVHTSAGNPTHDLILNLFILEDIS
jgi:hypothetical protein